MCIYLGVKFQGKKNKNTKCSIDAQCTLPMWKKPKDYKFCKCSSVALMSNLIPNSKQFGIEKIEMQTHYFFYLRLQVITRI